MVRRSRLVLAVVTGGAALAVLPGAQAKAPPDGVDLCGASSCVQLTWQQSERIWVGGRTPVKPVAIPSAFYIIRWRWQAAGPEQVAYYMPAVHVLRWPRGENGDSATWLSVDPAIAAALEAGVAGLAPYAVSPPSRVSVGGKPARGPETYFRLLSGPTALGVPAGTIWVEIKMRTDEPGPWTDGVNQIQISAGGRSRLVSFDGWSHRVPWRIANRARRGLPLSP